MNKFYERKISEIREDWVGSQIEFETSNIQHKCDKLRLEFHESLAESSDDSKFIFERIRKSDMKTLKVNSTEKNNWLNCSFKKFIIQQNMGFGDSQRKDSLN